MTAFLCGLLIALSPAQTISSPADADTTRLWELVEEALDRNPELEAARQQMDAMGARIRQEGTLPAPELIFMREGMPAFRYSEAMFSRVELMQMIPFPSKLATAREIAGFGAEHAHHDHMEKEFEILYRLKSSYAELWYLQQSILLARHTGELLAEALAAVRARYGAGGAGEEDVLKASVECARNGNLVVSLRQRELGEKAMIMALLDRDDTDTLGTTVMSDSLSLPVPLDTLLRRGMEYRPMIQHDSLSLLEQKTMLTAARQEYLPDLRIGVQYMTGPMTGFNGWTVTAGITLPFAPWALGARDARVDESIAGVNRAGAALSASRAMVRAGIRDLYAKAAADIDQVGVYRRVMLPRSASAARASLDAYRSGKGDFLMVLDAFRMLNELTMEMLMLRMDFARTVAGLEKEIGVRDLTYLR